MTFGTVSGTLARFQNRILFGTLANGSSRLYPPFGEVAAGDRFVPDHAVPRRQRRLRKALNRTDRNQ
jgi:hypothetical protein